ncbi:MAG: SDR family oxidoreductase [Proteobacteria bacterium]|nr:SDR family oxidoreductase [Pseudomonadota bacterium]
MEDELEWRSVCRSDSLDIHNEFKVFYSASIEGLVPFTATVSYVASKHAVVGLSTALRIEGADLGVKVSVVCPGFIDTAIFQRISPGFVRWLMGLGLKRSRKEVRIEG